ncbi:MAG: hypothetical protein U1E23_14960 [Reyranellaceae bacterium]
MRCSRRQGVRTNNRRRYVGRWEILTRHRYDPVTDLKRNVLGVVDLAGNKLGLRLDIHRYFLERDEDSNSLGMAAGQS